jgi:4-hydroxythreonine-4-phosphate dehydrogenase
MTSSATPLPRIALTIGDPAGIGPEIALRAATDHRARSRGRIILVGDIGIVRRAARTCGLDIEVRTIDDPDDAAADDGVVNVIDIGLATADEVVPGQISAVAGRSATTAIETAVRLALDERVDAISTAPINKEAIWAAGSPHLGHTEMIGELTGATEPFTMFVVRGVKIFFATRHMSLRKAIAAIDTELIANAIETALEALNVFGDTQPHLAVAAMNPHGGEGGHFGTEETDFLVPAIGKPRKHAGTVSGPVPADSVFHQAFQGQYHGVLALYHDQGHIASKTLDFDGTVSVTAGLPILRTSVDHGTAFDIAGTGRASAEAMVSALVSAADLSQYLANIRATYQPKPR